MVDSGAVYHFTGKWTSDYSLNFSCNTKRNGKDLGLTIWMTSKISGQMDYRLYTTIGEETLITDEGKLMKKK